MARFMVRELEQQIPDIKNRSNHLPIDLRKAEEMYGNLCQFTVSS